MKITACRTGGYLHLSMRIFVVSLFLLADGEYAQAQQAPVVRVYLPNRSDEDWSFLERTLFANGFGFYSATALYRF